MKIRNSSRITAIVLALMMIVPLISIPALADDAAAQAEAVVTTPVWTEDFDNGTVADHLLSFPATADIINGIGGNKTNAYFVDLKATCDTQFAVMDKGRSAYWKVTSIAYADASKGDFDYDTYDGSEVVVTAVAADGTTTHTDIKGVITPAATVGSNRKNAVSVTDKGSYTGTMDIAIVEGITANAIVGDASWATSTIERSSYLKNSKVTLTSEKVVVLSADYYFSTDTLRQTIEGRVYAHGTKGSTQKRLPIDLFFVQEANDDQVMIVKHSGIVDVWNANVGMMINKGEWVNIKFLIDATSGVPTVYCYVNDELAFVSAESTDWAGYASVDYIDANTWNLGHMTRGIDPVTLNASDNFFAADNCEIYTSDDALTLDNGFYAAKQNALFSMDFTGKTLADVFATYSSTSSINTGKFSTTGHGNVFARPLTPIGSETEYDLMIAGANYKLSHNWVSATIEATVDQSTGKATGTATFGGTTYYFKDTTIFRDADPSVGVDMVTLYTDANYNTVASEKEYYLCTMAYRETHSQIPNGIVGAESVLKVTGVTGQTFTVSADYYFDMDVALGNLDIRINKDTKVHFFQVQAAQANDYVTVMMHSSLTNAVSATKTLKVTKGEWHNFTWVVDASMNGEDTRIKGYVDGYLVGEYIMDGTELTEITALNLGHNARLSLPSQNQGTVYVDNVVIYAGDTVSAIYDETNIHTENFETGSASQLRIWLTGSSKFTYEYFEGHNAMVFDSDTYDYPNKANGTGITNLDAPYGFGPALSASDYDSVVFESKYFLPHGSIQALETHFRQATVSVNGAAPATQKHIAIYTIKNIANDTATISVPDFNTNGVESSGKESMSVPVGEWFTVSTVVDLDTAVATVYVNGVRLASWRLYRNGVLTSISSLDAGAFAPAKLTNMKNQPYNTTYPYGYTGCYAIDDVKIYEGTAPRATTTPASGTTPSGLLGDFENRVSGIEVIGAKGYQATAHAPAGAIFTDEIDGDMAVRVGFRGVASGETADPFVIGIRSRAHNITAEAIGAATFGEAGTTPTADQWALLSKNESYSDGRYAYYVRVGTGEKFGDTVYVYDHKGGKGAQVTSANDAVLVGTFTLTEDNYNAKYYAMGSGTDLNLDKNLYINNPALTYNAEGNNTYAFSVNYYVSNDAYGKSDAQFHTGAYLSLYTMNLQDNKLEAFSKSAALTVDAWNNVSMVVTLNETSVDVAIYLNGIFVANGTLTGGTAANGAINANSWIVSKPNKCTTFDACKAANGYIYMDDISIEALNASDLVSLDTTNLMDYTINGVTYKVTMAETVQLYAPNGYSDTTADEFFADYQNMIATTNTASIRLKDILTESGLRFATKVDKDLLDALYAMAEEGTIKSVRFGTLIAPLDGYTDLSLESLVAGKTVLDVEADYDNYFNVDDSDKTTHFVGSIVKIWYEDDANNNYDRDFSGRGYVEITLNNGTVYRIYSENIHTVSVADQARKTLDAIEEGMIATPSAARIEILKKYAALAK